jgi:hypothetical protein
MPKLVIATAAAIAALAFATPALAQFGGDPNAQVDYPGDPNAAAAGTVARPGAPDDGDDVADDAVSGKDQAILEDDDGLQVDGDDADMDDPAYEEGPAGDEYAQSAPDPDDDPAYSQESPALDEDRADQQQGPARWQGEDGRSYCRRSDGTTGTIVGAGAGALVGRGIDTGRHRGTGTIIGAIAGALIGRAVEQGASCK